MKNAHHYSLDPEMMSSKVLFYSTIQNSILKPLFYINGKTRGKKIIKNLKIFSFEIPELSHFCSYCFKDDKLLIIIVAIIIIYKTAAITFVNLLTNCYNS